MHEDKVSLVKQLLFSYIWITFGLEEYKEIAATRRYHQTADISLVSWTVFVLDRATTIGATSVVIIRKNNKSSDGESQNLEYHSPFWA